MATHFPVYQLRFVFGRMQHSQNHGDTTVSRRQIDAAAVALGKELWTLGHDGQVQILKDGVMADVLEVHALDDYTWSRI